MMDQTERMKFAKIMFVYVGMVGLLACRAETPNRTAETGSERPGPPAEPAPLETVSMEDEEIKTIEEKQVQTPRAAGLPCAWARIWENPGPKPMPVGGAIKAPKKLHDVAPVVPYRKIPPTGSPILEAIIATDGKVSEAKVVSSFDPPWPEGDAALVEAVNQWAYKPSLMDGKPVPVCIKIMLNVEWTEFSRD
jgi:hypothetical protein